MPSDKPNWKMIAIVLVTVAVVAVLAAVLTFERVSMEAVLLLALAAVAASLLLNWYISPGKQKGNKGDSPDRTK